MKALFLVLFLSLSQYCVAGYYSTVTSWSKLEDRDCYIIEYTIFDDNSTWEPTDDINVGNYTTVVGKDCNPQSLEPISVAEKQSVLKLDSEGVEEILNGEINNLFAYTNPIKDETVYLLNKNESDFDYQLINQNGQLISAVQSKSGKLKFENIPNGVYILIRKGRNKRIQTQKIVFENPLGLFDE